MNIDSPSEKHSAWNPGLESQLPREYLPLATIFRAENVTTTAAKAYELSDFCGLPAEELIAFRVDRLIIHELLVHVTTGIAVPDGRDDEDLGKNFRGIAATILNRFITPHREELARVFEELKNKASAIVERELSQVLTRTNTATKQPVGQRWPFSSAKSRKPSQPSEIGRGARSSHCFGVAEKSSNEQRPLRSGLLRCPAQSGNCGHRPPRPAIGRQNAARRAGGNTAM